MAAEGKALARVDGRVVFVPQAAPDDLVDIQVTKKRRNYMEGHVTQFHELSPHRVKPFCEHFGVCGGCKWQHIPYSMQLELKQKQVEDQLTRIGKVSLPVIQPILGSNLTEYYRNKLEFTFSNSRWFTREEIDSDKNLAQHPVLGFHVPGMFDKIFDVERCYLQSEPSNSIRLTTRDFAIENGYSFYDIRSKVGFLRNLTIRTASTGDTMVILSVVTNDEPKIDALMSHLMAKFPMITSLMYVVNPKANDTINDLQVELYAGKDYIMESIDGINYKVGAKSFFQTNTRQAQNLFRIAKDFAQLKGDEIVYDLYTGIGTIANYIARSCAKVVGIEYVQEAIDDAIENSRLNGIYNTHYFAGDIKEVLSNEFIEEQGAPTVVIIDPPRAGVHHNVLKKLIEAIPERIVYVSCNPATQARDINLLNDYYQVTRVQPVDMFPHTHHVENVLLLERINR